MRNKFIGILVSFSVASIAHAEFWIGDAPAPSTKLVCGMDGTVHFKDTVQVNEPGQPGLVWVGMHNPDKTAAYLLTLQGSWVQYDGGLLQPAGRYDGGLPAAFNVDVALPRPFASTGDFVGWQIYEGHGVYTKDAQDKVATRRSILNEVKPSRVAAGTWNAEYDSDDRVKWALVQKDMTDNGKYIKVLTIPYFSCNDGH